MITFKEWVNKHHESVYKLYTHLLNQNSQLFNNNNCSFNYFLNFCYQNSSKDKFKYI